MWSSLWDERTLWGPVYENRGYYVVQSRHGLGFLTVGNVSCCIQWFTPVQKVCGTYVYCYLLINSRTVTGSFLMIDFIVINGLYVIGYVPLTACCFIAVCLCSEFTGTVISASTIPLFQHKCL